MLPRDHGKSTEFSKINLYGNAVINVDIEDYWFVRGTFLPRLGGYRVPHRGDRGCSAGIDAWKTHAIVGAPGQFSPVRLHARLPFPCLHKRGLSWRRRWAGKVEQAVYRVYFCNLEIGEFDVNDLRFRPGIRS
jgi:hypothetical protein